MQNENFSPLRYLPSITTAAALILIAAGLWAGEARDVWQKAVSICLSCIGIG